LGFLNEKTAINEGGNMVSKKAKFPTPADILGAKIAINRIDKSIGGKPNYSQTVALAIRQVRLKEQAEEGFIQAARVRRRKTRELENDPEVKRIKAEELTKLMEQRTRKERMGNNPHE
jgi:hypothetical protein